MNDLYLCKAHSSGEVLESSGKDPKGRKDEEFAPGLIYPSKGPTDSRVVRESDNHCPDLQLSGPTRWVSAPAEACLLVPMIRELPTADPAHLHSCLGQHLAHSSLSTGLFLL